MSKHNQSESVKQYVAWKKAFRKADADNGTRKEEERKRVAELKRKKAEEKDAKKNKATTN